MHSNRDYEWPFPREAVTGLLRVSTVQRVGGAAPEPFNIVFLKGNPERPAALHVFKDESDIGTASYIHVLTG